MPGTKSQHFVSQFYLRNFGHGDSSGLIRLYNRRTKLYVPHAPIKTQSCANYFYEKGDEIETKLGEMENRIGPLICEMIRAETPPKWSSADHTALVKFVVFQHSRTRLAKDASDEQTRKTVAQIDELCPGMFPQLVNREVDPTATPQMLLRMAEMNYHAVLDLRCKLIRNTTAVPFITSDHPVVHYNQYYEEPNSLQSNCGLNCRGLQIFLPLNPKYLLVLFDSDVYKIGERNFKVTCVEAASLDVTSLNMLQVVNSGEHLYFNEETSCDYLEALLKKASPYLKTEMGKVRTGPAIVGGKEHGTIIHTMVVDIQIGLDLSCMKILPKAKEKYSSSYEPRVRYRNLELQEQLTEFGHEVLQKRFKEHQFDEFRKTWKRHK